MSSSSLVSYSPDTVSSRDSISDVPFPQSTSHGDSRDRRVDYGPGMHYTPEALQILPNKSERSQLPLEMQLVVCVPIASISESDPNVASTESSKSSSVTPLVQPAPTALDSAQLIVRPVPVSSIPTTLPVRGLETEVVIQPVHVVLLPPSNSSSGDDALPNSSGVPHASTLQPHPVLLKRAIDGKSSSSFARTLKHEVDLFRHACKGATQHQSSRRNLMTRNSASNATNASAALATANLPPLLRLLSTHCNGVWGPIACVSADGRACAPPFEVEPLQFPAAASSSTATTVAPTPASISRDLDTTVGNNTPKQPPRKHSCSRKDSMGLLLPDLQGVVVSTLISSWHQFDFTSAAAQPPIKATILEEILACAMALTDQIHRIHQLGIVLRAIRPTMMTYSSSLQQASFLDFSHATLLQREPAPWSSSGHLDVIEPQWPYMAPELTGRINRMVDSRSDLYSLGMVLYTMLCGRPAFVDSDVITIIHEHVAGNVHWPHSLRADPASPEAEKSLAALKACIVKLLTKDPEERYQTAVGLQIDLAYCLNLCKKSSAEGIKGDSLEFVPGRADMHGTFQISQKLYGRKAEIDQMLEIYASLKLSKPQLLLIGGHSGVGKTALVNEVHLPMVRQHGLYCKTKFDLYRRNPSVIFEAFDSLLKQVLASGDMETWQTSLLQSLNGQAIHALVAVLPILSALLGPSIPLAENDANAIESQSHTEAQLVLQRALVSLVKVFATTAHPLVLFVDDVQWADATSLNVLKLLFQSPNLSLMIIGAYRSNEVNDQHPLMLLLNELRNAEQLENWNDPSLPSSPSHITRVSRISCVLIAPLTLDDVVQLLADSFRCDALDALPLGQVLYQQSRGNPFFLTVLLHSYHQHGVIYFDYQQVEWQWQLEEMKLDALIGSHGNVVLLLEQQVKELPLDQQNVLKVAACLGNRFSVEQLAVCLGRDQRATAKIVWPLLQTGFLIPLGNAIDVFTLANSLSPTETDLPEFPRASSESSENSQLSMSGYSSASSSPSTDTKAIGVSTPTTNEPLDLRFLHDSVQQASYQLIDSSVKFQQHLMIARRLTAHMFGAAQKSDGDFIQLLLGIPLLEERMEEAGNDVAVTNITEQYNVAAALVTTPVELRWVIQCNLHSGERARINTMWEHCHNHAAIAFKLLQRLVQAEGDQLWSKANYRLSINVSTFLARALHFMQRFTEAESVCKEILLHTQQRMETQTTDPQAKSDYVRALLLSALIFSAQPAEANRCIEQTLLALQLLHIKILEADCPEWKTVADADAMVFVNMIEAVDKQHIEVMRIMASILATMFALGKHDLLRAVVYTMLHMSMCFGISLYTACALVYHGGSLSASENADDVALCVQAGSAGTRLLERFRHSPLVTGSMKARVLGVYYALCAPWGQHFKYAGPAQLRLSIEAVHDGEFEYGGYTLWHSCIMRWYSGEPLLQLSRDFGELLRSAYQHGHKNQVAFCMYTLQLVQKMLLLHGPDDPFDIDGKMRSAEEFAEELLERGVKIWSHFLLKNQLQVLYYANDFARAAELVPKLASMRAATAGHCYIAMDLFFSALTMLRAVSISEEMRTNVRNIIEIDDLEAVSPSQAQGQENSEARRLLEEYLPSILYSIKRMETWSITAPMNFLHRVHLLKAELQRVKLFVHNAVHLIPRVSFHYRKAIEHARANEFVQDQGLASELEGRFLLELGRPEPATTSLRIAFKAYQQWQCRLKIDQLQREFGTDEKLVACAQIVTAELGLATFGSGLPRQSSESEPEFQDLFESRTKIVPNEQLSPSQAGAVANVEMMSQQTESNPMVSPSATSALDVDFLTISHFTQMCSLESDPQMLLHGIMESILRSACATTATLVLKEIDKTVGEQWNVELIASLSDVAGVQTPQATRSVTLQARAEQVSDEVLPMRVFHYVLNSKEPVTLSQPLPSESIFGALASDPYFSTHNPSAILCAPLLKSGSVIGAIYLESSNNARAFVTARIPFLLLLCSQAALSITNSRLFSRLSQSHSSLEDLVTVRTSELSLRNKQLEVEVANRKDAEERMRAAKEEAEVIARQKNDFLNNMAHEVRTPMNAVIGASRLLADTSLSLEQQQLLNMINVSGNMLISIVNDILDFNKIEAHGVHLRLSPHNLVDIVDAVMMQCFTIASTKKLRLETYVDPGIPPSLLLDSNRLQQILLNLISNAIKFTREGSVQLHVNGRWAPVNQAESALQITREACSPGDSPCVSHCTELSFEVRDTGIGISPEQLSGLFRSFSQVRHNSSEFGGTGLGLVISKRLVCAMSGGGIEVDSALGRGSTFSFRFTCFSPKSHGAASGISDALQGNTALCLIDSTNGVIENEHDLYGFSSKDRAQLSRVNCLYLDAFSHNNCCVDLLRRYGCTVTPCVNLESGVVRSLELGKRDQPDPDLCDVIVVDLDTLGVHEQMVLEALSLAPRQRLLLLYSHPHQLNFSNPEVSDVGDRGTSSQATSSSTLIAPTPGVSVSPLIAHSLLEAVRKKLQKPIRGSSFLHAVLAASTSPLPHASDSSNEGHMSIVLPDTGDLGNAASDGAIRMRSPLLVRSADSSPVPMSIGEKPIAPISNLASSCPLRILLAEDNVINQKMMVMLLRKLGYQILVARNGVQALQLLEQEIARGPQHEIECILMDASMDTMDGLECTRIIRAHQMPHTLRPYIITQTANVTDDYRHRCEDAGMDAFLAKPIQLDMLKAGLQSAYAALHTNSAAQDLSSESQASTKAESSDARN